MKILGDGSITLHGPEELATQTPSPQEMWQESVVLLWWDPLQSIGGYHRIGHETNIAKPMSCTWSCIYSPQGIYKKNTYLPLAPPHRTAKLMTSGDGTVRYEAHDVARWCFHDAEIHCELVVADNHVAFDGWPKKGQISEFSPHHIDIGCRVKGYLEVKGKRYAVDALAFRDHAWGLREWQKLLSHRWCVGNFGPELSVFAMCFQSSDDVLAKFGWIVRDGQVIFAESIEILASFDCDGVVSRGGKVRMVLPGNEKLTCIFEPVAPGYISVHMGLVNCDTIARVICGDKRGIGCFETTNNPLHGTRVPTKLVRSIYDNGWHDPPGAYLLD